MQKRYRSANLEFLMADATKLAFKELSLKERFIVSDHGFGELKKYVHINKMAV